MFLEPGTTKRSLTTFEKGINDVFDILHPPFAIGYFQLDMTRTLDLLSRIEKDTGRRPSLTAFFIKASAISLLNSPALIEMLHGSKIFLPPTIDISVSVAGRTRMAPLALVRDVINKSLPDVSRELAVEVTKVREKEERDIANFNRFGWLLPRIVRRFFLRLFMNSYRGVRNSLGTFQISNVSAFCYDYVATRIFVRPLLITGAIKMRPYVVDDRLEARPTCIFTLHVDHRLIDGVTATPFIKTFATVLEQDPAITLESGAKLKPEKYSLDKRYL